MIVKPSKGRALLRKNSENLEIKIPSKKNIGTIIFSLLWLVGWAYGEYSAYEMITGSNQPIFADLFMIVWFTAWTIAGFFVVYSILWSLFGEENLSVERGSFRISNKIFGVGFTRDYEINSIKKMHVDMEPEINYWSNSKRKSIFGIEKGNLSFGYGMKTIKFGKEIDEIEAEFILEKFKLDTKFKENNF